MHVHISFCGLPVCSSVQIMDFYFAYRQSVNRDRRYRSDFTFSTTPGEEIQPGAVNIAWLNMPDNLPRMIDHYDLVFVANNQHPLEVATQCVADNLMTDPRWYFVSGGYLAQNHPAKSKVIWYTNVMLYRDLVTRPFFPQFFDFQRLKSTPTRKSISVINGQNRSHRLWLVNEIRSRIGDRVDIQDNFQGFGTSELLYCFFESDEDRRFRDDVNRDQVTNTWEVLEAVYDLSVGMGQDQKFGFQTPGFFTMDQYLQYNCIVYPETCWINDEIFFTEKIWKCCAHRNVPWPMAGANTHRLYNELGIRTVLDILPREFQDCDTIPDHKQRYLRNIEAMSWALDHPEIWVSPAAEDVRQQNYVTLFDNTLDGNFVYQLDDIFQPWQ